MIKETQTSKEKWGLFNWKNVVSEFALREDRAWSVRQEGKRREEGEVVSKPDFVHMIGQRPRKYEV